MITQEAEDPPGCRGSTASGGGVSGMKLTSFGVGELCKVCWIHPRLLWAVGTREWAGSSPGVEIEQAYPVLPLDPGVALT